MTIRDRTLRIKNLINSTGPSNFRHIETLVKYSLNSLIRNYLCNGNLTEVKRITYNPLSRYPALSTLKQHTENINL